MLSGEKVSIHFETEKKEMTLAIFLLFFLNLIPPALLTYGFIIRDYLKQMQLEYHTRFYPAGITKEAAGILVKTLFESLLSQSKKSE